MAAKHLLERGCAAMACEVRCPICRYRVDVAGYQDSPTWEERSAKRSRRSDPRTFLIECKQSRSDFLRDVENLEELLSHRAQLENIRLSIERHRVMRLEPQLRKSGTSLFPELEEWDFSSSRLPSYRQVLRKLRRLDERLHGETKFFLMARYALADQLYIAAPAGMIRRCELPPGWGLMVCDMHHLAQPAALADGSAELRIEIEAPHHASSSKHRIRLLRNIAVSACRAAMLHASDQA